MRYTPDTIETSEEEFENYTVVQSHIYTTTNQCVIPKGTKVVRISYEKKNYDLGCIVLKLDNGNEVEQPFDIELFWENFDVDPAGYVGLDKESNEVFRSGLQYADHIGDDQLWENKL